MKTNQITVAIAEHDFIFRAGLVNCIQMLEHFSVQIEANSGRELIQAIESANVLPDLCVFDITAPQWNAYEVFDTLRKKWPILKILILSPALGEYAITYLLTYGVSGMILKSVTLEQLNAGLLSVHFYGSYFGTIDENEKINQTRLQCSRYLTLTKREIEIIKLAAHGHGNKEISVCLGISLRTLHVHIAHIFSKINVHTRDELILFAKNNSLP